MIPYLLLLGVGVLLDGIALLLPSITIPYEEDLEDFSIAVGGRFAWLEETFGVPIGSFTLGLSWVAGAYLPCRYGWQLFQWIWARVPFL